MKSNILKSVFIINAVVFVAIGFTGAYFSGTAVIAGNQFSTGTWATNVVINEVYYDTGSRTFNDNQNSKTEEEGKNEWIELYNPTSTIISLNGWSITDNSGVSHIFNGNHSIQSNGFVLLSHDADTWKFWTDTSVEKVNLGGNPGNGWLANAGDRVLLKNGAGDIVDEMSYGTDITVFSLSGVAEGHSLERKNLGVDTGSAVDFEENNNPTPGV